MISYGYSEKHLIYLCGLNIYLEYLWLPGRLDMKIYKCFLYVFSPLLMKYYCCIIDEDELYSKSMTKKKNNATKWLKIDSKIYILMLYYKVSFFESLNWIAQKYFVGARVVLLLHACVYYMRKVDHFPNSNAIFKCDALWSRWLYRVWHQLFRWLQNDISSKLFSSRLV